jgi:hypothetical protein
VTALLRYDDDTLLTGSSDGLIRVLSVQPNRMLGVLGEHSGGWPGGARWRDAGRQLSVGLVLAACWAWVLSQGRPAQQRSLAPFPNERVLWPPPV